MTTETKTIYIVSLMQRQNPYPECYAYQSPQKALDKYEEIQKGCVGVNLLKHNVEELMSMKLYYSDGSMTAMAYAVQLDTGEI